MMRRNAIVLNVLAVLSLLVGVARAEKVTIDSPYIRAIQTFTIGENKTDSAYLLLTGVVNGETVASKLPKEKAFTAGPKQPPVNDKAPLAIWEGDLDKGQFVFLNVTLFQGDKLSDDKIAEYRKALEPVIATTKAAKSLDKDGAKEVIKESTKAQVKVVTDIKKIFSREKGTDHFNGSFNILVYNDGGKIRKHVDPVGLTFGEHYGTDVKLYSKIKYTLENVLYQDPNGQWYEYQLGPTNDDETVVRIKMLETEKVKVEGKADPVRNVTDYLIDLRVLVAGKAQTWVLGGEEPGPTIVHDYWGSAD